MVPAQHRLTDGEELGGVAGVAVVAGEQAGEGGESPDRGAVLVRRGERLLGRGAVHHGEEAARSALVERVVAVERRDLAAVLAAPVEGGLVRARGRFAGER